MTVWRCFSTAALFPERILPGHQSPPWMDNIRYYSFTHVHIIFRDARFYESALDWFYPEWSKMAYKYFERKMNLNS